MPLCPQITNTPITVTQTADFTVSSVLPVVAATTTQVDNVVVLLDGKTKAYYQTVWVNIIDPDKLLAFCR
jgi:hypothetical protein